MLRIIINLLEIVVLYKLLHFGHNISFTDHILAILGLISALITGHLHHLLGVVIPGGAGLALVVDVNAAVFEGDSEFLGAGRVPD